MSCVSRHLPSNLPLYLLPSNLPMGLSDAGAVFSSVRLQGKALSLQGNSVSAGILPNLRQQIFCEGRAAAQAAGTAP